MKLLGALVLTYGAYSIFLIPIVLVVAIFAGYVHPQRLRIFASNTLLSAVRYLQKPLPANDQTLENS